MRIRNTWQGLKLNLRSLLGSMDAKMELATREAARIWLRKAIEGVPTWSGASRATFEQLADSVGERVPINIAPNAPNRTSLGRLHGRGGVERDGKNRWRFFYENNLRYLEANETRQVGVGEAGVKWGLIEPTPYQFREAALQAVNAYAKTVTLPRIQITSF